MLAHRNPPKGNSLCHTGLKGPFRPYTPRNVPLPSTVAPCVFVGVQPSSIVNNHSVLVLPLVKILVFVSSLNFSVIAHIQIHLLTFQSSPRGRSRPPYMDFFLLICRRHESISYETPHLLVMISYASPSPLLICYSFSGRHFGTVLCFVWWALDCQYYIFREAPRGCRITRNRPRGISCTSQTLKVMQTKQRPTYSRQADIGFCRNN